MENRHTPTHGCVGASSSPGSGAAPSGGSSCLKGRLTIEFALSANLVRAVGGCAGIKRLPTCVTIGRAPIRELHCGAIHDGLESGTVRIRDTGAHHGAAASQSLGIHVRILFADACLREGADDSAGRAASC